MSESENVKISINRKMSESENVIIFINRKMSEFEDIRILQNRKLSESVGKIGVPVWTPLPLAE